MTNETEKLYEMIAMTETAAEDLSAMSKSLPKEMCATVAQILSNSTEVARLEKAAASAKQAAEQLEGASKSLTVKAKRCALAAGILAIAIPLIPCILAYRKNGQLKAENAKLLEHVQGLRTMREKLTADNPHRFELVEYQSGALGVILPSTFQYSRTAASEDGREITIVTQRPETKNLPKMTPRQ